MKAEAGVVLARLGTLGTMVEYRGVGRVGTTVDRPVPQCHCWTAVESARVTIW